MTRTCTRKPASRRLPHRGYGEQLREPASSTEAARTNLLLEHISSECNRLIEVLRRSEASLTRKLDRMERNLCRQIAELTAECKLDRKADVETASALDARVAVVERRAL